MPTTAEKRKKNGLGFSGDYCSSSEFDWERHTNGEFIIIFRRGKHVLNFIGRFVNIQIDCVLNHPKRQHAATGSAEKNNFSQRMLMDDDNRHALTGSFEMHVNTWKCKETSLHRTVWMKRM